MSLHLITDRCNALPAAPIVYKENNALNVHGERASKYLIMEEEKGISRKIFLKTWMDENHETF